MTRKAIQELVAALRPRYQRANKGEKRVMLNEFCAVTGYHRKAAIRLLNAAPQPASQSHRRGRKPRYDSPAFLAVLLRLWEASGRVCAKRLTPFLAELAEALERHGEILLTDSLRQLVQTVSASTVDRLLKPHRARPLRQPHLDSRHPASLRDKIQTRTFADLRGLGIGHVEADLVLHCGMSTVGFFLTSLVTVDIATGWVECRAVWGKGQSRVGGAVDQVRVRLPFPLRGVHSDNGSEFINAYLEDYCCRHAIDFSHSRSYHKNDCPRVEQRNGSLVRRLIGYDRYTTKAAYQQLQRVYNLLCLHANFFQPICKLVSYERQGSRVIKRYDRAQTAYQRLLALGVLDGPTQERLEQQYLRLNPLQLYRRLQQEIEKLWKLDAPDPTSEQAARLRQLYDQLEDE